MKVSNQELALEALTESSPKGSVGAFVSETETSKGVLELKFENKMRGYAGWFWFVTLTQIDKRKPLMVSEINLMAGEDAMLAPAWVPWAERLADFRKQLKAEGRATTDAEADKLIRDMALSLSNDIEGEESQQDSDNGSANPPQKTRVRQRRIKRNEDHEDQEPDSESD